MEYSRGTRGYATLKLREQGYKTVTSHIMAEGLADVDLLLTQLSVMNFCSVRPSRGRKRPVRSPSCHTPGSKGRRTRTAARCRFSSRKQLFPDAETHETFRASRSDGELATLLEFILFRTGLMLIAECGVKRRSNISWTLSYNARLPFCNSTPATSEPRTLAYPGYIPQKHVQL